MSGFEGCPDLRVSGVKGFTVFKDNKYISIYLKRAGPKSSG